MSAVLYVVGTPIGNLGDLSPRAVEAFESCDFIAAEDTRVTLKLLNSFEIKKADDKLSRAQQIRDEPAHCRKAVKRRELRARH